MAWGSPLLTSSAVDPSPATHALSMKHRAGTVTATTNRTSGLRTARRLQRPATKGRAVDRHNERSTGILRRVTTLPDDSRPAVRGSQLRYERPPLIEALCEFGFRPASQPWDWLIPARLYELISTDYPRTRHLNMVGVEGQATENALTQRFNLTPRIQLISADERSFVQVSPRDVVVNQLQPYIGWEAFRHAVTTVYNRYREVADGLDLARVALRYKNVVNVGREVIELNDYFRALPTIPDGLPQVFGAFRMRVDVHYDDPAMVLGVDFGTADSGSPDQLAYGLEFTMTTTELVHPAENDLRAWLDVAHDRIEDAFWQSLTPMAHEELFGLQED